MDGRPDGQKNAAPSESGERMNNSCLVDKLSFYADLKESDHDLIRSFEQEERVVRPGPVYRGGDPVDYMYVVKQGWFFASTPVPDGRRQIVKVYHPGDIVGFPDIAFHHATIDLNAAEEAVLCPFPKNHLDSVFSQSPRLTALLFTLALRDQVILIDYIRALGRLSAIEKVAFFLLDTMARLRITNRLMTKTFRLPLRRSEIGDILGLTNVYVSKTFNRMERDGLIERATSTIRILDEARLVQQCDFVDRYKDLDTSWFPKG